MQRILSASDIANEMSMMRSAYKGTFLVVEGATDCRLYSKFIDSENVRIIVAHSKNNVANSVTECRTRRKDNSVLGIVDRDMDPLLNKKRNPPIFSTDKRDMESTILSTPALGDVLAEYGDADKIRNFTEKNGAIGDCVAKAAEPIGMLMYISYKRGMNLSFKDLEHSLFIDGHTLYSDLSKLVATVYGNSMAQSYPRSAIVEQLRSSLAGIEDHWIIARGHDAVTALKLGLRFGFGSYNSRNLSDDALGGALRLAYSRKYFEESELFRITKEWAEKNNLHLWSAEPQ